jgi:cytochrome P450
MLMRKKTSIYLLEKRKKFVNDVKDILPEFMWKYSSNYKYEVKMLANHEVFNNNCKTIIEKNRNAPLEKKRKHNNFINNLLKNEHNNVLSVDEIIANTKLLFIVGTETTSIAIAWTLYFLTINKEYINLIRQEVDGFFDIFFNKNKNYNKNNF